MRPIALLTIVILAAIVAGCGGGGFGSAQTTNKITQTAESPQAVTFNFAGLDRLPEGTELHLYLGATQDATITNTTTDGGTGLGVPESAAAMAMEALKDATSQPAEHEHDAPTVIGPVVDDPPPADPPEAEYQ